MNETTLIVQTSVDLPRSEGRSDRCFDGESDSMKSTQSTKVPFNAPFAALEPPAAISGYVNNSGYVLSYYIMITSYRYE